MYFCQNFLKSTEKNVFRILGFWLFDTAVLVMSSSCRILTARLNKFVKILRS